MLYNIVQYRYPVYSILIQYRYVLPEMYNTSIYIYISGRHSSYPLGYFTHISITTPIVSALKNYYR
jgi:hypothetical protein